MAEITWHTGTTSDSSEVDYADFYCAGSLTARYRPLHPGEEEPIVREDAELTLVFKNGERKGPFTGEDARKDLAALEAAHFEHIRCHPAQ